MNREEKRAKTVEFLSAHWGDLSKHPFEVHAKQYFGDAENFDGLVDMGVIACDNYMHGEGALQPFASLLIAALKAAYDLGRESMLQ